MVGEMSDSFRKKAESTSNETKNDDPEKGETRASISHPNSSTTNKETSKYSILTIEGYLGFLCRKV